MTMTNLMMAGNTLMQMRTMQSTGTKLQGRANVLKSELEHDKSPSENKKAEMEELEGRAQDVMGQMMETAQKTNDELKQNAVDKDQKEETEKLNEKKEEEDSKKDVTDRVELSGAVQESQNIAAGLIAPDNGYGYTSTGMPQPAPSFALTLDITA